MTTRKLASIQKVLDIAPIEGADKIEVAQVLGWRVVVNKGEFRPGDMGVYVEIDSVLPVENPDFAFLEGKRLRTRKMRGQISQGICFPLSVLRTVRFPNDTRENPVYNWKEGMDVTDQLGVTQWQPIIPACLLGVIKGSFPSFIPKTDEMRIQAYPRVLDRHKFVDVYITEKVDGSSATFYLRNGEFGVCSRNVELVEGDNAFWKVAKSLNIEKKLRELGDNIAIQGELLGPGIQGNKYALTEFTVRFYGAYDMSMGTYLNYRDALDLVNSLGMQFVPFLGYAQYGSYILDEWVKQAEGKSMLNPKTEREGIVIRALQEAADIDLGRLSVKAINPRFLLKYDDS